MRACKGPLTDSLWTYLQNYAAKHKAAGNGFGLVFPNSIARTLSVRYHNDGSEILVCPRECALKGFLRHAQDSGVG